MKFVDGEEVFRRNKPYPKLDDRIVIIVDDGLASGYTMLSAINFFKNRNVEKIIIAVPTASLSSIELIHHHVDCIVCLNVRSDIMGFAVADAYVKWYDLTDNDVLKYVDEVKEYYIPYRI